MKRYYSGTGSSSNPGGSLGGAITTNEIANSTINAVWDDTSLSEASAGDTEYRCFYIKWVGAETVSNVVLFLSAKAHGPQDSVFIGKGTAAKNGTEQTIANETANPVGVTFNNPGSRTTAITIASSMSTGEFQSVWLKRTIDAGAEVINLEDYELACQYDPSGGGGTPLPPTPPPGGEVGIYEHSFFGDTDCGGDHTKNITNVKNRGVKLHFPLGDYSYEDSASCWTSDVNPIKDKIKVITMGNHEVEEGVPSSLKTTYLNYVGQSNQWASFVYRNQHYLVLSEFASYGVGSAQYNFALQKLQQYATDPSIDWRFVLFHEPIYTNPAHHDIDDDGDGAFRDIYHPLFDQYNVDFMLSGHNHDFQRSYPLTYNGGTTPTKASTLTDNYVSPFDGVIQIICGTGGRDIYTISSQRSYFVTDGSSQYEQHGYGILEFSNNDKTLKIKFYNVNNTLINSCTITKLGATVPTQGSQTFVRVNAAGQRVNLTLEAGLWNASNTKFSASIWFYAKNWTDRQFMTLFACQNNTDDIFVSTDSVASPNQIEFGVTPDGYVNISYGETSLPSLNAWHHYCITYDSTLSTHRTKIYVDGVLGHIGQDDDATGAISQATEPMVIGAAYDTGTGEANGYFYDFRYWAGTALTQAQITDVKNGSQSAPTPGYWLKMDEGTGNPVDSISGSKVGTLTGGASWATIS
jgi:hypothetical protein